MSLSTAFIVVDPVLSLTKSRMDIAVNGSNQRYSISNHSHLARSNSALIAHRLSVYMPNIFLPSKNPQKLIFEINSYVATFREMLIQMGQVKDNPDLREKIRKYRQMCMEECKQAVQIITALVQSVNSDDGSTNTSYLILLSHLLDLFSKELIRNYRLIQVIPLDMAKINENRNKPTNFGNIIGQILLCKEISPDFNQEDLRRIKNDLKDIKQLMAEILIYVPRTQVLESMLVNVLSDPKSKCKFG